MVQFDMENFGESESIGTGNDYKFFRFGMERQLVERDNKALLAQCALSEVCSDIRPLLLFLG